MDKRNSRWTNAEGLVYVSERFLSLAICTSAHNVRAKKSEHQ